MKMLDSMHPLLIEPVWNRNPCASRVLGKTQLAFNRTSMESKQLLLSSKKHALVTLLIEPVWNRNAVKKFSTTEEVSFF